jgi:phage terminase large subunit
MRLKLTAEHLRNVEGFLDSAEPDRIQEFKDAGFEVYKANKSVDFGLNKVQSYDLYITRRSVNIIREIQGYVWAEKNGQSLDIPVKLDDHAMDGLRYGLVGSKSIGISSAKIEGI